MMTRRGEFSSAQTRFLNRVSNQLSQRAQGQNQRDWRVLGGRQAAGILSDVREELKRRRALRSPAVKAAA